MARHGSMKMGDIVSPWRHDEPSGPATGLAGEATTSRKHCEDNVTRTRIGVRTVRYRCSTALDTTSL